MPRADTVRFIQDQRAQNGITSLDIIKNERKMILKMSKHLNCEERLEIKRLLENGFSARAIAQHMRRAPRTIYYEIERGSINGVYSPEFAESRAKALLSQKGPKPKLTVDEELPKRISRYINEDKLTALQVLEKLKQTPNGTRINSVNTLYSAIDKNLIPDVTRESLLIKETTLFSKGKIHIPRWIREDLGLKDGDTIKLELKEGKLVIEKSED